MRTFLKLSPIDLTNQLSQLPAMTQATIHEAKTHLSKLIQKALAGEKVIIANRDEPIILLSALKEPKARGKRPLGWAKAPGFYMAEDFNKPLDDFEDGWPALAKPARRRPSRRANRMAC